ncbi:interferon regulatory factor 1b [Denticeps clupeoides]|uniref:Interferon regulatory factor n=1 Tax=Denticeps clupeoides TaxID=299321 RepID=A0AAY4CEN5_9TELE|nr:interferon regulatory factor 1-like [Denticeps clupeoides]
MPVTRMRMRPWLERKIDSNTIDGLVWVDKEKKMFSIPWKHAARHGWQMEKDACLFQQWAVHTGKYKPGETAPDPKTWKANFRCAMNSLPDIEEVKHKSVNKGCGAVRVYRMLQEPSPKEKKARSRANKNKKREPAKKMKSEDMEIDEADFATAAQDDSVTQENTVDSTGHIDTSYSPDVPDFTSSIEIGTESTSSFFSFQVSPLHTTDFGNEEEVIEITRLLERDHSQWLQSNINGKGFLSNEVGMMTDSYHSSESQWSETSGDEVELRVVTELAPWMQTDSDQLPCTDMWSSNILSFLPPIACPH